MDGKKFDDFSRIVAAAPSRRAVLKGLVGGLGGLAAAAGLRGKTAAQGGDLGTPCTRARDCASFRCVDGVCCDTSCTGQCEACNVAGSEGTCTPVSGQPVGERPACPGAEVCQASCDGVTGSHCTDYPGPEVECAEPACDGIWLTTYGCGGNGACHATTTTCFPYRCAPDGTACGTTCAADEECADGASCVEGQCVAELPLGEPCGVDAACASGHCVNEVCCVEVCEVCKVCNLEGNEGFCGPGPDDAPCDAEGGDTCCQGDCVNTLTDVEHCGACNSPCLSEVCRRAVCVDGVCGTEPLPERTPCDDGDACTEFDACNADGQCVGTRLDCDDGDACTVDSCDPATGCVSEPLCPAGQECLDGTCCPAVVNDVCTADCETGGTCGDFPACDPTISGCSCSTSAEGGGHCTAAASCPGGDACTSNADCPEGFACSVDICCQFNVCEPLCEVGTATAAVTFAVAGPTSKG